jgi:hypothetical protein
MLAVLPSYGMPAHKNKEALRREKDGITSSGAKKTIWFHEDEAEALRLQAFKERRSESSLIRESVRRFLNIED